MNFFPLSIITFLFLSFTTVIGAEVNIYSHRQPFLINPFLEKLISNAARDSASIRCQLGSHEPDRTSLLL